MSEPNDYRRFARTCARAGLASPAHWHGQLLGLISVFDGDCEDPLAALQAPPELSGELPRLYRETWQTLDGVGCSFSLLLPDEDSPLGERSSALIAWAQGFLQALQVLGVDPQRQLDDAGRAALGDIREVAASTPVQLAEDAEQWHEVAEFLWIGVVLVRELLIVHRESCRS